MLDKRLYTFSYMRGNFGPEYKTIPSTSAGYALDFLMQAFPEHSNWEYQSDSPLLVDTIRTVLGDSRPIVSFYANSQYACPYCGYPCDKPQCFNPFCEANPNMLPERLTAIREKDAQLAREKLERESIDRFRANAARECEERREASRREYLITAKEGGYCMQCATRYPPKMVRHRKECPHTR